MKKALILMASVAALGAAASANAASVGVYVGDSPRYVAAPAPVIVEQRVYPSYVGGYYHVAPEYYHRGNRHDRNWRYWHNRDRRWDDHDHRGRH